MKKLLPFVLLFAFTAVSRCAIASNLIIEVTEGIGKNSDQIVRQAARVRASYMGMSKLPVILKGNESIRDGVYDEYITALGSAYVVVETLQENWNREAGTLTLTANVKLDNDRISEALVKLSGSEYAVRRLKALQNSMEQALKQKIINEETLNELEVSRRWVFVSPMVRMSVNETVAAKSNLVNALATQLRAALNKKLSGLEIHILDASYDSILVTVPGYKKITHNVNFVDGLINDFYEIHKKEISLKVGEPCLQVHRYRLVFSDETVKKTSFDNSERFEYMMWRKTDRSMVDVQQGVIINMKTYPLEDKIEIKGNEIDADGFFDVLLQDPDDYLKLGVCIYHEKAW